MYLVMLFLRNSVITLSAKRTFLLSGTLIVLQKFVRLENSKRIWVIYFKTGDINQFPPLCTLICSNDHNSKWNSWKPIESPQTSVIKALHSRSHSIFGVWEWMDPRYKRKQKKLEYKVCSIFRCWFRCGCHTNNSNMWFHCDGVAAADDLL